MQIPKEIPIPNRTVRAETLTLAAIQTASERERIWRVPRARSARRLRTPRWRRRRGRPKKSAKTEPKPPAAVARGRPKRANTEPKPPKPEAEYFPEQRNLEELWLSAFPIGTEWENIDKIKEFNWNFENLEKALEEGGKLYGKMFYLFGSTEPQRLDVNGESKMVFIPIVVAVDCPFPPSDKIGIKSVQRENEEIVPMKAMKMAWLPCVPLEDWLSRIDSLKTKYSLLAALSEGVRSSISKLSQEV